MGQGIIKLIQTIFMAIVTLGQNRGKKLTETLVEVEGDIKADRKQDRHLKHEPKILYGEQEQPTSGLYFGNKEEILKLIDQDLGNVLTRKQEKIFKREVEKTNFPFYRIAVHPLTQHEVKKK